MENESQAVDGENVKSLFQSLPFPKYFHRKFLFPPSESYAISMLRDLLISITLYLYKFSRNYRYVHEILTKEKKLLKIKSCR